MTSSKATKAVQKRLAAHDIKSQVRFCQRQTTGRSHKDYTGGFAIKVSHCLTKSCHDFGAEEGPGDQDEKHPGNWINLSPWAVLYSESQAKEATTPSPSQALDLLTSVPKDSRNV